MTSRYWFSVLLVLCYNFLDCTSAAVHGHSVDTGERESDGSFKPRDSEHYSDTGHNVEFDHEAILGSVKEAEEFDKLSPEEAKEKLAELLVKMDVNNDKQIDQVELKKWIITSFVSLSREEAQERLAEADENRDGLVTWKEYLQETFGVDDEAEIDEDTSGMLVAEEKAMWRAADVNNDGVLDIVEFEMLTNPDEHAIMQPFLVNQTLREKDKNGDGKLDFQEYIGDRGEGADKQWLIAERDKFDHELDLDHDGILDQSEIHRWVIPNNDEIADEEVEHLMASADDDHDGFLSFNEVLEHYEVFVGSEATDYGNDLYGQHFGDEL